MTKRKQTHIRDFLTKKAKLDSITGNISTTPSPVAEITNQEETAEQPGTSTSDSVNHLASTDISHYINKPVTITSAIDEIWIPSSDFKFPGTTRTQKLRGEDVAYELKFQREWFRLYPWLAYSKQDFVVCKFCVFFVKNQPRTPKQCLGAFVNEGFNDWKKAHKAFRKHQNCTYHLNSVKDAEQSRLSSINPETSIQSRVNQQHLQKVMENRQRLVPIIETIFFCGKQELALRGHRDAGGKQVV